MSAEAKFCATCGYATARLAPGQTLDGKYEILEKIGEGGMGEVYKARHVHLDEIRIIKVTKPDPLGEGLEPRRFQEEARIATLVRHPNVAALYDFSRMPDGSYYMVWEFIDGVTLEEWLRRYGPLPAGRALEVARQVLAGLAQIHAQGIVHRDLSPDNIMLRETRDGKLSAKIIDLGIAKRVVGETLQKMTGTGMFVGKLKYCSPEQAGSLPAGETVDGRSDLYSFGVVLYEMLSGKPPFESQTPEGYIGKHLHAPPPPLDTTRLPARIGPLLSSIVTRALEKRRDRRFRSADEFAAALADAAPAAGEQSAAAQTAAMPARRPGVPAAVWIAALLLLVAAGGAYLVLHGGSPLTSAAMAPTAVPIEAPPEPTPTSSPDAIVVQSRILENPTPAEGLIRVAPTSLPTRVPTAPPTRPPEPTAVPTAIAAAPPPLRIPGDGELTEAKLRRMLEDWTMRPIERRANQAVRVAYMANYWAGTHPGDPLAAEIKQTLPKRLKEDAENAAASNRPGLAMEFYAAYMQLNPTDGDALRRLSELRSRFKAGPRQRRLRQ